MGIGAGWYMAVGEWEPQIVYISELLSGGDAIDMGKIHYPFSIWPVSGWEGVHIQINNVRWVQGGGASLSSSSSASSESSSSSSSSEHSSSSSSTNSSSSLGSSSSVDGDGASSSSSSSSSVPGAVHTFYLYEHQPSTLVVSGDGSLENTLETREWEETLGNVESDPAYSDTGVVVWDVLFHGMGNVSLTPGDTSSIAGADRALRLVEMAESGALVFDLRVISMDEGVEFLAKIDSGWPFASYTSIEIPEADSWTTITVPFSEMIGTNEPDNVGEAHFDHITYPFIFEVLGGTAHVQLNNIRITCEGECGIELDYVEELGATFTLLENGELADPWYRISHWDNDSDSISIAMVEDDSGESRGLVTELYFNAVSGAHVGEASIETFDYVDLSAFATNGGYIEFDLRVLEEGMDSGTQFTVWPTNANGARSTTLIFVPSAPVGQWETVQLPTAGLFPGDEGFDLSRVHKGFAIHPSDGDQYGVRFQIDDVRWVAPVE